MDILSTTEAALLSFHNNFTDSVNGFQGHVTWLNADDPCL